MVEQESGPAVMETTESGGALRNHAPIESAFSEDELVQLAFLRDEEADELVSGGYLDEDARLSSPLEGPVRFEFRELILHVRPKKIYPVLLDTNDFFSVENLLLSRVPCDELRAAQHVICDDALQTNTLSIWNAREDLDPYGLFKCTMLILRLVQEAQSAVDKHRAIIQRILGHEPQPTIGKAPSTLMSASEMARELLGRPEDIVARIPSQWRVLHVEEILRRSLARDFYVAREQMRESLQKLSHQALRKFQPPTKRRGDVIDHLLRPRLTFHGTGRANVPSIVRHGFLKPGSRVPWAKPKKKKSEDCEGEGGEVHQVACGSTYGRGIYSSPSAAFALSYSGWYCEPTSPGEFFGLKLVACAVLMGRTASMTRDDEWWLRSDPFPGSDSHVGNNEMEYIVFDSARILPIYVLHLDWGAANEQHLYIPSDPYNWSQAENDQSWRRVRNNDDAVWAGDKQREKEAIMAKARKWFPFGYGPKSGNNFVVEEVGYVSEDEENYGEYQAMRATENEGERRDNMGYWSWVKSGCDEDGKAMSSRPEDEYTYARIAGDFAPKDWKDIPPPDQL